MMLSILIATVPERKEQFGKLYNELTRQIAQCDFFNEIDILADPTPKEEITIGAKMNALKQRALSKYICFFGDDDWPAPDYIEQIAPHLHAGMADIITFNMNKYVNGIFDKTHIIGIESGEWQIGDAYYIDRIYFTLCPHRTRLVTEIEFPDQNGQSDIPYSAALKDICQTEHHINKVLYNYYYSDTGTLARGR